MRKFALLLLFLFVTTASAGVYDLASTGRIDIPGDFLIEVNKGKVSKHKLVHKFGSNSAVGTTKEDVWSEGGEINWLLAAETLDVISSDTTNDISTGTGCRTVKISGLDAVWDEIDETATLLATAVTTTKLFIRVNTLECVDVGTYTGTNLGNITATASTADTIQGAIPAGEGRSSQSQYTIPAGKSGYIIRVSISIDSGKTANINLHTRSRADIVSAPFQANLHLHHWDGLGSPIEEHFLANHKLLEKTDVWFDAVVPATSASVDVDYDLLLVDN